MQSVQCRFFLVIRCTLIQLQDGKSSYAANVRLVLIIVRRSRRLEQLSGSEIGGPTWIIRWLLVVPSLSLRVHFNPSILSLRAPCSDKGRDSFSAAITFRTSFACSHTIRARSFLSNRSLWFRKWTGSSGNIHPFLQSHSFGVIDSYLEWLFSGSIRLLAAAISCFMLVTQSITSLSTSTHDSKLLSHRENPFQQQGPWYLSLSVKESISQSEITFFVLKPIRNNLFSEYSILIGRQLTEAYEYWKPLSVEDWRSS
jgi:hypothetical protein